MDEQVNDVGMGQYPVARLRLQRAIAHGESLSRLWNEIPTGELCTPKAELIDHDGNGVLRATQVGSIPDELPLLLGEQLYQLRSALDACLYQAAIYATKSDPPPDEGKLEFPITNDQKEWPNLVKRRLAVLPVEIQGAIKGVQPFLAPFLPPPEMVKNINRSLGFLHELARKDRHRKLHIMGSWPMDLDPIFTLPNGVIVDYLHVLPPSVLKEGTIMVEFHLKGFKGGEQISVNPQLRTTIGCDDLPAPCDPSDTFDKRLAEMINAVGSVIYAFEQHF
jgi:hypothetical protein